jgi:transcriptional regulator with XRE-family HTH domain
MFIEMNGAEVTRLREEQGLSKKDLAKAANVTQATIARAERSQQMYPATARKIDEALGVDARSLGSRSQ